MKKMLYFCWMASLLLISGSAFSDENPPAEPSFYVKYETAAPGKFLQEWMDDSAPVKNTLVLLDLDDTSIATPANTWLGSSEMFYQFRSQLREKYPHLSNKQVVDRMNPLFFAAYARTPLILTDHRLPEAIDKLQQLGANIVGLTARAPAVMPITLRQIKQVGLSFSSSLKDSQVDMQGSYPVEIKNGVVFVGHGYKKGEALVALLKAGKLGHPSKVILIDDRDEHLNSTGEALKHWNKNITFIPVLCTYPQGKRESYQDKVVKSQLLNFVYEYRDDAEVKSLIKNDLYTDSLITEQCEKPAQENLTACKALLPILNGK